MRICDTIPARVNLKAVSFFCLGRLWKLKNKSAECETDQVDFQTRACRRQIDRLAPHVSYGCWSVGLLEMATKLGVPVLGRKGRTTAGEQKNRSRCLQSAESLSC